MTQHPTSLLSEAAVIDFLQKHPDFLNQHPEVLLKLEWTDSSDGSTISFAEKQISYLRQKITGLERKLMELVQFGNENDDLLAKYHTLSLRLIRANTLTNVFSSVYEILRQEFNLPYVAIRVWQIDRTLQIGPEFETVNDLLRRCVEQMQAPAIDRFSALPYHEILADWLWEASKKIGSAAIIPLRDNNITLGALLIGSPDSEHFSRQMSTVYLEQMAAHIAAAIIKNK